MPCHLLIFLGSQPSPLPSAVSSTMGPGTSSPVEMHTSPVRPKG